MRWLKWLPLRYIISKAARTQGFLDPIELLARLRSLAQPSEVGEPVELLRAGMVFHARGLINSKVIQQNLDWVWPYWIEKQYDPSDISFIPRAFSVTHINLTHRNWTAVGYPDCSQLPIVDPRGLLTPFIDGWSLDACVITRDGKKLVPSRTDTCRQRLDVDDNLSVVTETTEDGLSLENRSSVVLENDRPVCVLDLHAGARGDTPAVLVLLLRPANPEGVSFIRDIAINGDMNTWQVNKEQWIRFDQPAAEHHVSDYQNGDVFNRLDKNTRGESITCNVGLATAAACFPFQGEKRLQVQIALEADTVSGATGAHGASTINTRGTPTDKTWHSEREQACRLQCPDAHYQYLYNAAVASLILHSPDDVYPGPYTYKRFWFRDAAFIIHALLELGMTDRAARAIERFPERQTALGYFRSQEGEWDSNGEVLWILQRFEALTGNALDEGWHQRIRKAARWIIRKRLDDSVAGPHAGLFPAGFSAEHLGPNDYYYWDDFWGIAGLDAAAALLDRADADDALQYREEAGKFRAAVDKSLAACERRLGRPCMPASPYRRMDAGAIGSLAAGYPLQLYEPDDPRLLDCARYLLEHCFIDGAFFQDMIHSGLNAYLTLQVAQVLLRAGDSRHLDLMDKVAALASPTGQWPEAIHPHTLGGCMGDGHHVWAAAEWALMLRNCFVREEGNSLVLCSGLPPRWLDQDQAISFGPAPTSFGEISVTIKPGREPVVEWQGKWHREAPPIDIRLPGHVIVGRQDGQARFSPEKIRKVS